jgi:hypothetical protein
MVIMKHFGSCIVFVMKKQILSEILCEREIRLSFRRTFSKSMMQTWCELVSVVE